MKKTKINGAKTISVSATKMSVVYTDSNKYFTYDVDESKNPTKEVVLFGKKVDCDPKKDYLPEKYRVILDDILYSKGKYTEEELKHLPLMRQYYIQDVSRRVEKALFNWKREIVNSQVDNLLLKLFPHSQLVKEFVDACKENQVGMDVSHINIHNLVSERDIVKYLQQKGLFPKVHL